MSSLTFRAKTDCLIDGTLHKKIHSVQDLYPAYYHFYDTLVYSETLNIKLSWLKANGMLNIVVFTLLSISSGQKSSCTNHQ